MIDLSGSTALVTGATSGIGLEIAAGLAMMGCKVLVHGRTGASSDSAVADISGRVKGAALIPLAADFASLGQVDALAGVVLDKAPGLDLLILNAGVLLPHLQLSQDGLELHFAVNHLAHFHLTNRLLPLLKANSPARIVVVSSVSHAFGVLDLDDLQFARRPYTELSAYSQSKLANILFTRALAKRLEGSGVTANALHPGAVSTNIARSGSLMDLAYRLWRPFMLSPFAGAKTALYLATDPAMDQSSGGYYVHCLASLPSALAQDAALAERLWAQSEKLVAGAPTLAELVAS